MRRHQSEKSGARISMPCISTPAGRQAGRQVGKHVARQVGRQAGTEVFGNSHVACATRLRKRVKEGSGEMVAGAMYSSLASMTMRRGPTLSGRAWKSHEWIKVFLSCPCAMIAEWYVLHMKCRTQSPCTPALTTREWGAGEPRQQQQWRRGWHVRTSDSTAGKYALTMRWASWPNASRTCGISSHA